MKAHYYPETDSVYIDVEDRPSVDSREIAPGVVVDYDERGNVVGLDIDRALRNRYVTPEMMLGSVAEQIRVIEEGHRPISHSERLNRLAELRNSIAHASTSHELFTTTLLAHWLASELLSAGGEADAIARREFLDFLYELRRRLESVVESELHREAASEKRR